MKKLACLVIDPYISTALTCRTLLKYGIAPIAILCDTWSDPSWKANRLKDATFEKIIETYSSEQYDALLPALEEYAIQGFIYGREGNTIYKADEIAKRFFPQFSNSGASAMRANKYTMNEVCASKDLMTAKQIQLLSKDLTAQQEHFIAKNLPVVVKPTQSSGSLGVSFCNSLNAVKVAVANLLGNQQVTGIVDEIVIQQQITGTEYFVDTVSIEGRHAICGIFRYKKILYNSSFIYRWVENVSQSTEEAQACIQYVLKALDAIGLEHGLAHTELIFTESGPCLIEINPRTSGAYGFVHKMASLIYGFNQLEYFAHALLKQTQTDLISSENPLKKYAITLFIQNWHPKTIGHFQNTAIDQFDSYVEHLVLKAAGTEMTYPLSLNDTVALILLSHDSYALLMEDVEAILELEKGGCLF